MTRKQIIMEIAAMEKTLRFQQNQVDEHRRYLKTLVKKNKSILLALILIPAFFIGWYSGKKNRAVAVIKHVGQFLFVATIAALKERIWLTVSNKLVHRPRPL